MNWYDRIPSWGSMLASIAVAVVAWVTLDPLIENLQIKQQNRDLREENAALTADQHATKREIKVLRAEQQSAAARRKAAEKVLESTQHLLTQVNRQVEQRREDLKQADTRLEHANARLDNMQNQLVTLAQKINKQMEERQALKEENAQLAGENARSKQQLKTVQSQLAKVTAERDEALKAQRNYILETIVVKVKSVTETVGKLEGVFSALKEFHKDPVFSSTFRFLSLIKSSDDSDSSTGRQAVESLFNSREFELLPDSRGRKLQAEIRAFMNTNSRVFDANLSLPDDLVKRLAAAERHLFDLMAAMSTETRTEIDGESRIPDHDDIANAEKTVQIIDGEMNQRLREIDDARAALHSALDEMRKELGSG